MSTSRLPEEHVGLNADWNCRAWAVQGGNDRNASTFIVEEEDGTFSFVQRFWCAERVAQDDRPAAELKDKPSAEHWGDYTGNDHLSLITTGLREEQAAMLLLRGSPENQAHAIAAEAKEAFWAVVARHATTGDLSPTMAMQLTAAMQRAVDDYLRLNVGN